MNLINVIMKERNEKLKSVGKIVAGVILLFILYLFALNGRYLRVGSTHILDKWGGQVYIPGSVEMPIIRNGEDIYKKRNEDEIWKRKNETR